MVRAVITGVGLAHPPSTSQHELWDGFFAAFYRGDARARRVFQGVGVRTRHAAVNPLDEDASAWGTGARMKRYAAEALPLGKEAVGAALGVAGVDAAELGLFTVVSCTGYATPGVDVRLGADLGMPTEIQRVVVGHMGCYAALPGLGVVTDFVLARRRPAVLLCIELTSLHIQPATTDLEQVVCHALFSDAAAAVVVEAAIGDDGSGATGRPGLELVDLAVRTDPGTADQMTWDVTDLGFRMGLSPRVPDALAGHVAGLVYDLLSRHGLGPSDVDGWAVHPGGPRIIDVVADELGLPAAALDASRRVLREHGNCSSPTVLLVLDELCRTRPPRVGRWVVALAFGPGLTLYAALLRAGSAR